MSILLGTTNGVFWRFDLRHFSITMFGEIFAAGDFSHSVDIDLCDILWLLDVIYVLFLAAC